MIVGMSDRLATVPSPPAPDPSESAPTPSGSPPVPPGAAEARYEGPSHREPPQLPTRPRVRGRPFQPGNPGGGRRKRSKEFQIDMKLGCERATKVLLLLMLDKSTAKETRRRCAEFFITYQYGRPPTALTGAEGAPLFPTAGSNADSPLLKLLDGLRARRNGGCGAEAPKSPEHEPLPPGATTGAKNGDEC